MSAAQPSPAHSDPDLEPLPLEVPAYVPPPPQATSAAPKPTPIPPAPTMDRAYVERHQVVERYLAGRLPPRAVQEFERFCRANPDVLDAIGLPDRVNAGLRLLDVSGRPQPWEEAPRKPWEKLPVLLGAAGFGVACLVLAAVLGTKLLDRNARIVELEKAVAEQPLLPATSTRPITVIPARNGPTRRPAVTIGQGGTQMADLKIDVSWSKFSQFKVLVERQEQGRVAVLHNVLRNSNGQVRIALNSSALGPGNYDLTLQGLTWRGQPVPQAWVTIAIAR
jgi:hypothetical protein